MDEVGKVFAAWEDDTVWDVFTVCQLEKDGPWIGVDREEYKTRPPDYIAKIIWPEYATWWENYTDMLERRKKRVITREEAIKIASNVLIEAELSRKEFAEEEVSYGIQYDECESVLTLDKIRANAILIAASSDLFRLLKKCLRIIDSEIINDIKHPLSSDVMVVYMEARDIIEQIEKDDKE